MKLPRSLRILAFTAAIAGLAFVAGSAFFAWKLTGPMRRPLGTEPQKYLSAFETVRFPATDGVSLAGWFAPRAGAKQAVILLHGHGSTRTQMLARAKLLHDHGYAALLYDARGHGESSGDLVSLGWLERGDLLGAMNWLRTRGFTEFGLIGSSQGGATIALAADQLRGVRWVVLESVFPTLENALDRRFRRTVFLPGWLAGSLMVPIAEWRLGLRASTINPGEAVSKLPCAVFVMSGELDTHTMPIDARILFERAREPKSWWLVPGARHVDLYGFAKQDYERKLLDFISATR